MNAYGWAVLVAVGVVACGGASDPVGEGGGTTTTSSTSSSTTSSSTTTSTSSTSTTSRRILLASQASSYFGGNGVDLGIMSTLSANVPVFGPLPEPRLAVTFGQPPSNPLAPPATARAAFDCVDDSRAGQGAAHAAASGTLGAGPTSSASPSPRARLVAALTDAISAAVAAGDLHAARIAHEALGRLIAEPEPGLPAVADLGAERAKRSTT